MANFTKREDTLIERMGSQRPNWRITMARDYDPVRQRDEAFDRLTGDVHAFFAYDNAKRMLVTASRMASRIYPGDRTAQVEHIRNFDIKRKQAHNRAIEAIADMSHLCDEYDVPHVFQFTTKQLHDPVQRHNIESAVDAYLRDATAANWEFSEKYGPLFPHRTDEFETARRQTAQLATADHALEQSRQQSDLEHYHRQWAAVGTYDEDMGYLYDAEQAKVLATKDPDYVEHLAARDTARAAERRRERNARIDALLDRYGLSESRKESDDLQR